MALTPVEIRHVKLGRGPLGYRRGAVDRLLEEVVSSFEDVWRNRADLADRVEQLEGELVRYRELESLLRATLVTAERTAGEITDHARREADLILGEAHAEARAILRRATVENERLRVDSGRIRALLHAALTALEADGEGQEEARPEAA
jgi:cell division initiation protein